MINSINISFFALTALLMPVYVGADIYGGETFDYTVEVEVTINRPAKEVWAHVINNAWVITHRMERFSGEPNQEGEIWKVTPMGIFNLAEKDRPAASYHYGKTIKIVPEKQFVLKGYPIKGGSYGSFEFIDFGDIRLSENNGKTTVTFNGYVSFKEGIMTQENFEKMAKGSQKTMEVNYLELKKLAESNE